MALNPPPINLEDLSAWGWKQWFQDLYNVANTQGSNGEFVAKLNNTTPSYNITSTFGVYHYSYGTYTVQAGYQYNVFSLRPTVTLNGDGAALPGFWRGYDIDMSFPDSKVTDEANGFIGTFRPLGSGIFKMDYMNISPQAGFTGVAVARVTRVNAVTGGFVQWAHQYSLRGNGDQVVWVSNDDTDPATTWQHFLVLAGARFSQCCYQWNQYQVTETAAYVRFYSSASVLIYKQDYRGRQSIVDGITTVGIGTPLIVAQNHTTGLSAAFASTVLLASLPASGLYEVTFNANVTTAAGTSSTLGGANGFQITYTDADDSVVKTTRNAIAADIWNANTTATTVGNIKVFRGKVGTSVSFTYDYTSNPANAMVYSISVTLKYLS